jgi:uncharacterized protein (TIGR03435 family)
MRVLFLAFAMLPLWAQSFEVVSIRPHADASRENGKIAARGGMRFSGPRVTTRGASLESLVTFAYNLKPYEIPESGWPKWASDPYDVVAKAEGDAALTGDQFRPLFQALLADRFQLNFHRETKEVQGYLLTVAKGGPKLKESAPDAADYMSMSGGDHAEMTVVGWTMARVVLQFSSQLEGPVLDGTGLAGTYDFKLAWSKSNPVYPSFFIALQEQLGLKLEKHKGPVQLFMIDSAVRPSLDR